MGKYRIVCDDKNRGNEVPPKFDCPAYSDVDLWDSNDGAYYKVDRRRHLITRLGDESEDGRAPAGAIQ